MTPKVIGLDLSLTSTGIAVAGGTTALVAEPRLGMDRIMWLRDRVLHYVSLEIYTPADGMPLNHLVVIEDYAFSRGGHAHEIGELGGVIKCSLIENGFAHIVIGPTNLKRYALGKGNGKGTDKIAMGVAASKRAGMEFITSDECDAWWLRAMALDHYGAPVCEVPAMHRAALDVVQWPELAEVVA